MIIAKILTLRSSAGLQEHSGRRHIQWLGWGLGGCGAPEECRALHTVAHTQASPCGACYMMSPALWNHLPKFPTSCQPRSSPCIMPVGFISRSRASPTGTTLHCTRIGLGGGVLSMLHNFQGLSLFQPLLCCAVSVYIPLSNRQGAS